MLVRISEPAAGGQANGDSYRSHLSEDGRFVVYSSLASNLVPADTFPGWDVYVHDRAEGSTEVVSLTNEGEPAGGIVTDISADARFVVFTSQQVPGDGYGDDDNNRVQDVILRDRALGITERISVDSNEQQYPTMSDAAVVSDDGRYVAFEQWTKRDPQGYPIDPVVLLRDRQEGTTTLMSVTRTGKPGHGMRPAISGDGTVVAFDSTAPDLVAGDTNGKIDVFARDVADQRTDLVSLSSTGKQGDKRSDSALLSTDGRFVGFSSTATNLVPRDTNRARDVFVHNRRTGTTRIVSVTSDERRFTRDHTWIMDLSEDGRYVLLNGPRKPLDELRYGIPVTLYLRDRREGTTRRLGDFKANYADLAVPARVVAFDTYSSLVLGDSGRLDVHIHQW